MSTLDGRRPTGGGTSHDVDSASLASGTVPPSCLLLRCVVTPGPRPPLTATYNPMEPPRAIPNTRPVARAAFGVFGLAVMGQNVARNVASRDVSVAVYNRTFARTERMLAEHGSEGDFVP